MGDPRDVARIMRRVITASVIVAGMFAVAPVGAETPPPTVARIAVTHTQPVAGHAFVGFVVTSGTPIQALLVQSNFRGHVHWFHTPRQPPIAAYIWRIPEKAHGVLKASVTVETEQSGVVLTPAPVLRWRIKR
jgi:hypothetical protein